MKRPRISDDLTARADLIRGDVAFDRESNRIYAAGLDARERAAVAANPRLRERVNALRKRSLEAGDELAVPID